MVVDRPVSDYYSAVCGVGVGDGEMVTEPEYEPEPAPDISDYEMETITEPGSMAAVLAVAAAFTLFLILVAVLL